MSNIFFWFSRKFNEHRVSVHAAHVAFFILVSIFPFLMFLISLLQYTPLGEDVISSVVKDVVPGYLSTMVNSWLLETYRASNSTILSVTVIAALWTGSKGLWGIVYEMDQIYEVRKKRNLLICRLQSIFYTIVFTLMIIISLILLVYGNQIVQLINTYFPFFREISLIVFLLRSCGSFLVFVIYFYTALCPSTKLPSGMSFPGPASPPFCGSPSPICTLSISIPFTVSHPPTEALPPSSSLCCGSISASCLSLWERC